MAPRYSDILQYVYLNLGILIQIQWYSRASSPKHSKKRMSFESESGLVLVQIVIGDVLWYVE